MTSDASNTAAAALPRLYLLRHALAEDGLGMPDFDRALTPKGLRQARRMGRFALERRLRFAAIRSSPLVRAMQTAAAFRAELGKTAPEVAADDRLAAGARADDLIAALREDPAPGDRLWVGHEPDLSALVARLIGCAGSGAVLVRKAALVCIDLAQPMTGGGRLRWSLTPDLID